MVNVAGSRLALNLKSFAASQMFFQVPRPYPSRRNFPEPEESLHFNNDSEMESQFGTYVIVEAI
jgi:hypothetical protein